MISIFPGETIYVEADRQDNVLVNLKAIEKNLNPGKTITMRFWQELSGGSPMMMFTIINPFKNFVKYHAVMMLPDGEKLYKTSSCPVLGNGRSAYESWPHPIFQLMLFDFRLIVDKKGSTECVF